MQQIKVKSKNKLIFFILMASFLSLSGISCSTPTARERMDKVRASAHHSYAVDGMDSFWLDYRSPEDKEYKRWEFYYKHCTLRGSKPYYDQAEYMCTEPY